MITPPDDEKNIGIQCFFTETPGINGQLRVSPDDFVVTEQPIYPKEKNNGNYVIAQVTARNWETNHLIRELGKQLHLPEGNIKFAGTKDKRAVTTQLISFKTTEEAVRNINLKDVTFEKIYTSDKPLKIGLLKGNKFTIRVRHISLNKKIIHQRLDEITSELENAGVFPNFYGVQRFGTVRPITHLVGKYIVKGDYEKAVMKYVGNPMHEEGEETYELRRFVQRTHDFEGALQRFPKYLSYERMMLKRLSEKPDDFVNALKALPKNLLMMFIHAYQSYMFNLMLSKRIKRELPLNKAIVGDIVMPAQLSSRDGRRREIKVTERNKDKVNEQLDKNNAFVSGILLGTKSSFSSGEMGEIERAIVEQEKLNPSDFVIPEIPFLSSSGSRRAIAVSLNDFRWDIQKNSADEQNVVELRFELPKGCYATSLLREVMKCSDITHY